MSNKRKVIDWRIGFDCDHEQYWQGHGITFTDYTHCATGCGSTLSEALEDAFEDLAQQDIALTDNQEREITDDLKSQICKPYNLDTDITVECDHDPIPDDATDEEREDIDCAICAGEWHYYVNIDVIAE